MPSSLFSLSVTGIASILYLKLFQQENRLHHNQKRLLAFSSLFHLSGFEVVRYEISERKTVATSFHLYHYKEIIKHFPYPVFLNPDFA